MKDIILLTTIITIVIIYGYLQFSNNITDILTIKEGIANNNNNNNNNLQYNFITNTSFNITTEGSFVDFIIGMNNIISTGELNSNTTTSISKNPIIINSNAMISISNCAKILNGIPGQSFNDLITIFPDYIKNSYDVQILNNLYYSATLLNSALSKLPTNTDLSKSNNYIIYNSLLGYFNTFSNGIDYFNNIYINITNTNLQKKTLTEDNHNTKTYD